MEIAIVLGVIIISYLIGSISSAIIISKIISGKDIREEGSGNAGATNMLRVHGKLAGALTLIIDVLKGVIAILIAMLFEWILRKYVTNAGLWNGNLKYIAALFVVVGHDFPIFFKFRGGKGVATSLGVVLMLNWQIGLIVLAGAVLVMIISRYVSLGSVTAAALYPVLVLGYMLGKEEFNTVNILSAVILAVLLILKHKANISRLVKGTENKLFSKKGE